MQLPLCPDKHLITLVCPSCEREHQIDTLWIYPWEVISKECDCGEVVIEKD